MKWTILLISLAFFVLTAKSEDTSTTATLACESATVTPKYDIKKEYEHLLTAEFELFRTHLAILEETIDN